MNFKVILITGSLAVSSKLQSHSSLKTKIKEAQLTQALEKKGTRTQIALLLTARLPPYSLTMRRSTCYHSPIFYSRTTKSKASNF